MEDMLAGVSSKVRPTAVTRSLCARADLTMLRPMWPVAPKTCTHGISILNISREYSGKYTTHTRCLGGCWGPGGSQLKGNWSLEFQQAEEGEPVGVLPSLSIF